MARIPICGKYGHSLTSDLGIPQPDGQNAPPRFVTHCCVADMKSIWTSLVGV
jgi:hypothetical protein